MREPHSGLPRAAAVIASAIAGVLAVGGVAGATASRPSAQPRTAVIMVAPSGSGRHAGGPRLTLAAAQAAARADAARGEAVTVELANGTYVLKKPLVFTARDSGQPGLPIRWEAAPGAHPVISGGHLVTGWKMYDASADVFVASVPKGAESRDLYVNGALAPRASIAIPRSDVTFTPTGMTIDNPDLDYLASVPQQNQIEVEAQGSFTDRYSPVQAISGHTITMQEPAWRNNNWGYDTLASPFYAGQLLLQNSYSFLQPGQWYLNPAQGKLYYRAAAGENPSADSIVLPALQSLVQIAGSYTNPVHDLSFSGIQFSYTTWLSPGTPAGDADQQNGAHIAAAYPMAADFLTSCQVGCPQFEATRNGWAQVPAAVQVAAAARVDFYGDVFAHLGQVGLGLGQDADANFSGIGLGVSDSAVYRSTFTDLGGGGIDVGGILPSAHHPSVPTMTNRNITIEDNLVDGAALDYKDMSGILSTYVTHAVIEHNEVENLPYDGIDIGWGWGSNDPGGSQDYVNRGLYNYQPIYTTPTTFKDNVVAYNRVHATKKVFHDGGSIYNLSASPGTVIDNNYIYDNNQTIGLYLDEGSRYITASRNVVQDSGVWAFTNANSVNNTDDNAFSGNWYNAGSTEIATGPPHDNVSVANVQVQGDNWPPAAQQVIAEAGIQPPR